LFKAKFFTTVNTNCLNTDTLYLNGEKQKWRLKFQLRDRQAAY